jgi:hypothetical protein
MLPILDRPRHRIYSAVAPAVIRRRERLAHPRPAPDPRLVKLARLKRLHASLLNRRDAEPVYSELWSALNMAATYLQRGIARLDGQQ